MCVVPLIFLAHSFSGSPERDELPERDERCTRDDRCVRDEPWEREEPDPDDLWVR